MSVFFIQRSFHFYVRFGDGNLSCPFQWNCYFSAMKQNIEKSDVCFVDYLYYPMTIILAARNVKGKFSTESLI